MLCWWRGPNIIGDGVIGGVGAGAAQVTECLEFFGVCGGVSGRERELPLSRFGCSSDGGARRKESLCSVVEVDGALSVNVDIVLTMAVLELVLMCCGAHVLCKCVRLN